MRKRCVTVQRKGRYSRQEIASAAVELRESAGGPTALAFAFLTPDYVPHVEEFSEMVRVDGHVIELVGATGAGLTLGSEENEDGGGFALLALSRARGHFRGLWRSIRRNLRNRLTLPFGENFATLKTPQHGLPSPTLSILTPSGGWLSGMRRGPMSPVLADWRPGPAMERVSEYFIMDDSLMPWWWRSWACG